MTSVIPVDFSFVSSLIEVKADELQEFLRVTGDSLIFHVNDDESKDSFFKATVSSGFLTMAHLVKSTWEMWKLHPEIFQGREIVQMDITSKFTKPVYVGDKLRHHWSLISQKEYWRGTKIHFAIDIKRGDEVVAKVTRKLLYVTKHIIDCDAEPYLPKDWTVIDHRKGGMLEWNPTKIKFYLSEGQKGAKSINGHDLRTELAEIPVLNANVHDYLMINPHVIPEDFRDKHLCFWGTIFRSPGGGYYVRCMCWSGQKWCSYNYWLNFDFRSHFPALLLDTSQIVAA
jgi:acyl dehydratase